MISMNIKKFRLWIYVLILFCMSTADLAACDKWVASANATERGLTLLANKGDRLLFDSQPLMFYPRKTGFPRLSQGLNLSPIGEGERRCFI